MFLKVYPNYFCVNQELPPTRELCPTVEKTLGRIPVAVP